MAPDKKPGDRGVVDSIARLRELRYMTRGPGAKKKVAALPTVEQLREKVAKVPAVKIAKKKSKSRKGRR